ncbi:uncharacterized protein LOC118349904 [Juglans regia]|uniref:Uncharacterized protein LOC118349904 n=1 Tax=Juglans regia TaxID=51240 RepID=A0A6P9F784_JUGRE|nr:uncharacterized protein LOC118349904 [Juglans regia]
MGFVKEWIDLIMQCIGIVSYSILLNGSPKSPFKPSRGIRQGDPLSPYLFILCSEVLTFALNQFEQKGLISGFPITRGSLSVNHLFFTDDSLVFCKAQLQEWGRLHNILSSYESASSERLNPEKSSIYFSKNTRKEIQNSILFTAGIKASGPFERYLGLPSYIAKTRVRRADSFVWKSITAARPLLYEGLLWKIGNGNKVKIWSDRWLPIPMSYKTQSPPKVLSTEATVSSLIDQDTHSWNLPLVQSVFISGEVAIISRMHISPCNSNDKQVWRCTKNGIFSVKSAYHLQVSVNDLNKGQASDPTKHEVLWKLLWMLKVLNKAKMFLWRSAREILPTRVNLHKRKIIDSHMCPICLSHPKTVSHVLWTCKATQDVWSNSSRRLQKSRTEEAPFYELLTELLSTLPLEEHTKLALTAKEIWYKRNKFIFESKFASPQHVLKSALALYSWMS